MGWGLLLFFLNLSLNGAQISCLSLFATFRHRNVLLLNAIVCLALCDPPDEGKN